MNGVSIVRFAFEWQIDAIKKTFQKRPITTFPGSCVRVKITRYMFNTVYTCLYCLHMFILFTHVYTVHQNNIGRHIIRVWIIE